PPWPPGRSPNRGGTKEWNRGPPHPRLDEDRHGKHQGDGGRQHRGGGCGKSGRSFPDRCSQEGPLMVVPAKAGTHFLLKEHGPPPARGRRKDLNLSSSAERRCRRGRARRSVSTCGRGSRSPSRRCDSVVCGLSLR